MFEILEHPADIGFRATAPTVEELFQTAALALQSIAVEFTTIEPRNVYPVAAAGEDYETLLVAWLNEVLYYLDGEQVLLGRFAIDSMSPERIIARGWGEPRDPERHPAKRVVKGITFHQLVVKHEGGQWMARVFLDI